MGQGVVDKGVENREWVTEKSIIVRNSLVSRFRVLTLHYTRHLMNFVVC